MSNRTKYAEWAQAAIMLMRMAGYDMNAAWTNRLPGMFDRGYTPSDAVRVIVQGIRV